MTSKLLAFLTAVQTAVTGVVGLGTDGNDKFIDGRHYAITFEDNFDGTELDTSKWKGQTSRDGRTLTTIGVMKCHILTERAALSLKCLTTRKQTASIRERWKQRDFSSRHTGILRCDVLLIQSPAIGQPSGSWATAS